MIKAIEGKPPENFDFDEVGDNLASPLYTLWKPFFGSNPDRWQSGIIWAGTIGAGTIFSAALTGLSAVRAGAG